MNTILQCLLVLLLSDCFLDLCSSRRCIALLTGLGGCGSLWSLALLVGGSSIYHSFEGLLGTLENIKVGFFLYCKGNIKIPCNNDIFGIVHDNIGL